MWTDESMFRALDPKRCYVHCSRKDRFKDKFMKRTVKYGKFSVMVWAGVSYEHRTRLHIFRKGQMVDAKLYRKVLR